MAKETTAPFEPPAPEADSKKWLWPVCYALTLLTPIWAYLLWLGSGGAVWTLLLPAIVIFGLLPLLDLIFGEDDRNLSEAALKAMAEDPDYLRIVRSVIMLAYITFIGVIAFVVTQNTPLWAELILVAGTAVLNGSQITIGHELGHKTDRKNRTAAKIALGTIGYGHFTAEHNLGHHKNVSTPEDCASGRLGESVYAFATRELPGALRGAWEIESSRLRKRGLKVWSHHNEILQSDVITVAVAVVLVAFLGWAALPWILLHHAISWFSLTMVNYIEHYGLLRQRNDRGRYEPCEPHHSWNANHVVSNLFQFHLQRHSDHHAHATRPYQVLRHWEGASQLPTGYPGCMVLVLIPPLWFRVMDPKVIEWAEGDLDKTNLHEPARARLAAKWSKSLA